jgi:hypothetical protein
LVSQAAAFLLLLAAYDRDLVTQFGAFFGKGVDMKTGR